MLGDDDFAAVQKRFCCRGCGTQLPVKRAGKGQVSVEAPVINLPGGEALIVCEACVAKVQGLDSSMRGLLQTDGLATGCGQAHMLSMYLKAEADLFGQWLQTLPGKPTFPSSMELN